MLCVASSKAYRFASSPSTIRKRMSDQSLDEVFMAGATLWGYYNSALLFCYFVYRSFNGLTS